MAVSSSSSQQQQQQQQQQLQKNKKNNKKSKTSSKCRIRMEVLLWLVVLVMAGLIVSVNFMLLNSTSLSEQAENAIKRRNKRMKRMDPRSKNDGNGVAAAAAPKNRLGMKNVTTTTTSTTTTTAATHPPHHHVQLSPAKDPIPQPEKTSDELGPLLQILNYANVTDTPELRRRLPTWKQVTDRYGEEPVIIGLDTCAAFNEQVPPHQRILAPAGPFNSGTNLLHEVLHKNCHIKGAPKNVNGGIMWQVNWGKHQPPKFRFENYVFENMNNSLYMPVIPVRDPYTWMQSMCKNKYAAQWLHAPEHCPNLIPNEVEDYYHDKDKGFLLRKKGIGPQQLSNILHPSTYQHGVDKTLPVEVHYKSDVIYHKSLVDMWKDWYQEYYDSPYPRLMIRLEDIVFHPGQVLKQVCECVGGVFHNGEHNIKLSGESPKKGQEAAHGKNPTNLADAMVHHVFANRSKGMTIEDIKFAKYTLGDSIMDDFGYHPPF